MKVEARVVFDGHFRQIHRVCSRLIRARKPQIDFIERLILQELLVAFLDLLVHVVVVVIDVRLVVLPLPLDLVVLAQLLIHLRTHNLLDFVLLRFLVDEEV